MFDLIVFIIIIAVIVNKVKATGQKNEKRTTYVNGKPLGKEYQSSHTTSYRQDASYSQGNSYRQNGSYSQGSSYRRNGSNSQTQKQKMQAQELQALRDKVTKNLEQMRANIYGSGQKAASQDVLSRASQNAAGQDILSRAKQNVKENDIDFMKEADKRQHEATRGAADTPVMTPSQKVAMKPEKPVGQQIGADFDEDCDIMKKLNDLMIMGYSGNLEFDRDFIAESVDMLNNYQQLGSNL